MLITSDTVRYFLLNLAGVLMISFGVYKIAVNNKESAFDSDLRNLNKSLVDKVSQYERYEIAYKIIHHYGVSICRVEVIFFLTTLASSTAIFFLFAWILKVAKAFKSLLPNFVVSIIYDHIVQYHTKTIFRDSCVRACKSYNVVNPVFPLKRLMPFFDLELRDSTDVIPKFGHRRRFFISSYMTEVFMIISTYLMISFTVKLSLALFVGVYSQPMKLPDDISQQFSQENITVLQNHINTKYNERQYSPWFLLSYCVTKLFLYINYYWGNFFEFAVLALKLTFNYSEINDKLLDEILEDQMECSIKYTCLDIIYEKTFRWDVKEKIIRYLTPLDLQS